MEAKYLQSTHRINVCGRHGMEDDVTTHRDFLSSECEHRNGRVYKVAEVEIVVRVHLSRQAQQLSKVLYDTGSV